MKRFILSFIIGLFVFGSVSIFAYQADQDIDFDTKIPVGFDNTVWPTAIQNDGKILVGGYFSSYKGNPANRIIRLNSDGSIDSSFNVGNGFNNGVISINIQDDGKIIVGGGFSSYNGTTTNRIIRLNSDGSIDSSFNIGTAFNDTIVAVAIQDDEKIIIGGVFISYNGTTANRIIRLNSDGSIDSSFNIGSGFNNTVRSISIQNSGEIIVGGDFISYNGTTANRIIRLNSDGSIDSSFNAGTGFNNTVQSTIIQNDGKIIIGGEFMTYQGTSINRIIRLNSDGTRDNSFNIGFGFNSSVIPLNIQDDGKIIVGGYFTSYNGTTANRIIRLNSDGSRDSSFDIGLGFDNNILSINIQNDGKIIVGGYFTSYSGSSANRIIRLNSDGTRDNSFDIGNGFNSSIYSLAIQDDGKIIIGGDFTTYSGSSANRIIRLNSDGSIDSSFNIGSAFNGYINSINIQDDGRIIIGGNFITYQGVSANRIIRLNSDGSIDSSFNIGSAFNGYINSINIQDDGRIIIGGNFTTYQGVSANRIIRLNSDGSIDSSFNIGTAFNSNVRSIAIQDDEKIIIGGDFTTYSGSGTNRIIRLNSDGSIDSSFDIGNGFINSVRSIAIQNDNKIIVGGQFTTYQGISANRIIRLNSDGSRDDSFNIGTAFNNPVRSIVIQDDGKIVIGGDFPNYQGISCNKIIRLNFDGSRDLFFSVGYGFNNSVYSIAIQNDGKIFIGGAFTNYQNQPAGYLIALKGDGPVSLQNTTNFAEILPNFTYRGYTLSGSVLSGYERISLMNTNGLIPTLLNLNNQSNKLILSSNLQFKKTSNGANYTGEIIPPTPFTITTVDSKPVIKAVSVGSNTESLTIEGGAATLSIPAPGTSIGDPLAIYSSQNGIDWNREKGGIVTQVDGLPYVVFNTNHFTYFAIAGSTGSFIINNDDYSTNFGNVILSISAPTAQYMRFSNDGSNRSTWEAISDTKSRTLSEGLGTKIVYAEFDTDGDYIADVATSDTIQFVVLGTSEGQISLEILSGTSECIYGTSLNLGYQDVKLNEAYSFSGTFTGQRYCADYVGNSAGWVFTIQVDDLNNGNGGIISGSNLLISHAGAITQGDASCTGSNGIPSQFSTPFTLIEKTAGSDKICKVTLSDVNIEINIPANQAPGNYAGTLTIYVPNF